ncbi:MAG TPA: hypothetical protein VK497_06155 [Candidatus Saccharimonadales bacterium]|nr:hypothetical protein [Candidatus Saccharimonadales bacterium]
MKHQDKVGYDFNQFTKRKNLIIIGGVTAAVVVIMSFIFFTQPERSIASFCRVAKEEKSVLVGDVNYEKRFNTYEKLESVSPDDIRSDIITIRKGYEEIIKHPSDTLSSGFGMSASESRRTAYINSNCKDF